MSLHQDDQQFYRLTPDRVLLAAEEVGLSPTGHCMALNSLENRVYDLLLEDGNHVVMKFYRPGRWSENEILEEHRFLHELQKEDIPVCAPLTFSHKTTLAQKENIYYACWQRTGGRSPDEMDAASMERVGVLLARIHQVGKKHLSQRITFNEESFLVTPLHVLKKNSVFDDDIFKLLSSAVVELSEIYKILIRDTPLHRIHGDCHKGNLLYGNDGWFILDFDDFCNGPAVQDFWMLLPGRSDESSHLLTHLIGGYETLSEFPLTSLPLMELLRAMRYVHYAAWISKRWQDPAFKDTFHGFGSREYQEELLHDVEDQLRIILQENGDLLSMHGYKPNWIDHSKGKFFQVPTENRFHHSDEEGNSLSQTTLQEEEEHTETLTNRDYFWDWDDSKK